MSTDFCPPIETTAQPVIFDAVNELVCKFNDLEIWKQDDKFFAIFDAGAHQVAMRRDEITEGEAQHACQGDKEAMEMLFRLQTRLLEAGVDPYVSNYLPGVAARTQQPQPGVQNIADGSERSAQSRARTRSGCGESQL